MSKSVNALSVVGMVHQPKGESAPVPYVQMMSGDKKVGSFVRCEYIRFLLDNPAAARAAIAQAESLVPAPAPVVAAPVASAPAPVAAPAGSDPMAMLAAMAQQMAAMQAALGLAAPAPAVVEPASAPAPAVSVTPASAPLAARSRVRAAAKR